MRWQNVQNYILLFHFYCTWCLMLYLYKVLEYYKLQALPARYWHKPDRLAQSRQTWMDKKALQAGFPGTEPIPAAWNLSAQNYILKNHPSLIHLLPFSWPGTLLFQDPPAGIYLSILKLKNFFQVGNTLYPPWMMDYWTLLSLNNMQPQGYLTVSPWQLQPRMDQVMTCQKKDLSLPPVALKLIQHHATVNTSDTGQSLNLLDLLASQQWWAVWCLRQDHWSAQIPYARTFPAGFSLTIFRYQPSRLQTHPTIPEMVSLRWMCLLQCFYSRQDPQQQYGKFYQR